VLDPPCPVKAGDLLGFLGENPGKHQAEPQGGVPRLKARVAIEVFAGAEFPDYLAEARRRVAALPEAEKPMLIVEKGAKLCRGPRAAEMTLTPGYVLVPPAGVSTTGSFVYGSIHRIERVPVHSTLPRGAIARDYAKGDGTPCIDSAHYSRLNRTNKALYTQREILIPDGDSAPRWAYRDQPPDANIPLWDAPPLRTEDADLVADFELSLNRGQLNDLEASRRFVDIDGTHWWQIAIGDDGNECLLGWVCSKDHPGTRWESPHAWPAFHLSDATMFEPMAALQRSVCLMGDVRDEHRDAFEAVTTELGASYFITNLEHIIGLVGTRRGSVVSSDIGEAQQRPWIAHRVSRQIVRFESHWSSNIDRWTQLNPYMNADWHVDMERQEKSGWWNEVAGKLAGFPSDAKVHHIHPFGWVDNFRVPAQRFPRMTIAGQKVDLPFLEIFSGHELSEEDFVEAANDLQCEAEVIKAIAKVETGYPGPFFRPGEILDEGDDIVPTILYERHIFHRRTGGAYDLTHQEISDSAHYVRKLVHGERETPKKILYGDSVKQYERLLKAYAISPHEALMSASWGAFQIMGFNYEACGHSSVDAFVRALSESESNHLKALVSFMKKNPRLLTAIRQKDWTAIAKNYNGPQYDDYDVRMSRAYGAIKEND
ncbi:N-acetylmuramidase family protein, partial [Luteibacter sp. 22Crub2.1]|uniref:N-acetylmuramidase family protein n=1 Tax=Luteibacter sp. 22Crub2.1 TaxID=1283288 RepID=UPI0009C50441